MNRPASRAAPAGTANEPAAVQVVPSALHEPVTVSPDRRPRREQVVAVDRAELVGRSPQVGTGALDRVPVAGLAEDRVVGRAGQVRGLDRSRPHHPDPACRSGGRRLVNLPELG
jgi:hypothetical protein